MFMIMFHVYDNVSTVYSIGSSLSKVQENTSFTAMKKADHTAKDSNAFTNEEVLKKEGGFIHKGI